jgi:hypothetical protein
LGHWVTVKRDKDQEGLGDVRRTHGTAISARAIGYLSSHVWPLSYILSLIRDYI